MHNRGRTINKTYQIDKLKEIEEKSGEDIDLYRIISDKKYLTKINQNEDVLFDIFYWGFVEPTTEGGQECGTENLYIKAFTIPLSNEQAVIKGKYKDIYDAIRDVLNGLHDTLDNTTNKQDFATHFNEALTDICSNRFIC